jgi:hypothetical protein
MVAILSELMAPSLGLVFWQAGNLEGNLDSSSANYNLQLGETAISWTGNNGTGVGVELRSVLIADSNILCSASNGQVVVVAVGIECSKNAFARLGNQNIDRGAGRPKHFARTYIYGICRADRISSCRMGCGFTQSAETDRR